MRIKLLTVHVFNKKYTVSKNDTALACHNFNVHQPTLVMFGRNATERAGSQIMICFHFS